MINIRTNPEANHMILSFYVVYQSIKLYSIIMHNYCVNLKKNPHYQNWPDLSRGAWAVLCRKIING